MTDSVRALVRDLIAAGVSADLVGRVAEMAALGPGTGPAASVTDSAALSAGALRTRRWRARRAASQASPRDVTVTPGDAVTSPVTATRPPLVAVENAENPVVSADDAVPRQRQLPLMRVVTGVTGVTDVTGRNGGSTKRKIPRTPYKKNSTPQSPPRRHGPSQADFAKLVERQHVAYGTPLYAALLEVGRRRQVPGGADGWWFFPEEIAEAERHLAAAAARAPPSARTG